jgi:hypothetical protein
MAETSFDDDECREIAAVKIQAIARGMQTRTILQSNDIQTAKITLAARYEERSASLATVRRRSSGNNMNDSKVLAVRASIFFRKTYVLCGSCIYLSFVAAVPRTLDNMEWKGKLKRSAPASRCRPCIGTRSRSRRFVIQTLFASRTVMLVINLLFTHSFA